jgi:hypothetical protein
MRRKLVKKKKEKKARQLSEGHALANALGPFSSEALAVPCALREQPPSEACLGKFCAELCPTTQPTRAKTHQGLFERAKKKHKAIGMEKK